MTKSDFNGFQLNAEKSATFFDPAAWTGEAGKIIVEIDGYEYSMTRDLTANVIFLEVDYQNA